MNQSLTGRATNDALTGRQNGKKQNFVAERRVCVSLFAFIFMALASLFVHDHENIPHRLAEQSQRSVCCAQEKNMSQHYSLFHSFYYFILTPLQSAWRAIWNPTCPSCKPPLDNTFTSKISMDSKAKQPPSWITGP